MSKVSFEGIGEVVVTFACGAQVQEGQVVMVSGDGTVDTCTAGGRFCGVAISAEDGYAAVQTGGFAEVKVSGEGVSAGMVKLSADGSVFSGTGTDNKWNNTLVGDFVVTLNAETSTLTLVPVENPESLIEQTEGYEVCRKVVRNGQVLILRGENTYNVLGVVR